MIAPSTDDQGNVWHLHAIDFESAEGFRTLYLHAISAEHAAAFLTDMIQSDSLKIEKLCTSKH